MTEWMSQAEERVRFRQALEDANASGRGVITLGGSDRPTPVEFSHPSVDGGRALSISSGINSISWSYNLITRAQPTYGGEVIQVLGASIGQIQMGGNSTSSYEYERIRNWFVDVMTQLGTGRRINDTPAVFSYPERGWKFHIMPIGFGPWQLDNRLIATEWAMAAEMVSTTSNDLVEWTMGNIIEMPDSSKLAPHAFDHWRNLFDPGAIAPDEVAIRFEEMGNRMDQFLARMVSGDFDIFGREGLDGREADEIYEETFGTPWLVGEDSESESLGSGVEPTTRLQIVKAINDAFEAAGVPGRLGVSVALVESGLNPDARQDSGDYAMGLFQTFPGGAGDGHGPTRNSLNDAFKESDEDDVTSYNGGYSVSQQIAAAVSWFAPHAHNFNPIRPDDVVQMSVWAQMAQRAGVEYDSGAGLQKFKQAFRQAPSLIEQAEDAAEALGGPVSGTPQHIIETIVVPMCVTYGVTNFAGNPVTVAGLAAANAAHDPTTSSGNISDHAGPGDVRYAADCGFGTSSPTPKMDALANALSTRFGIPRINMNLTANTDNGSNLKTHTAGGYRYQLIYRSAGHDNHVHIGIARA